MYFVDSCQTIDTAKVNDLFLPFSHSNNITEHELQHICEGHD